MNDVIEDLRDQLHELYSIVAELDEEQLTLPSACEGWSLSDVLLHLAQTNEMAAASARGQLAGAGSLRLRVPLRRLPPWRSRDGFRV